METLLSSPQIKIMKLYSPDEAEGEREDTKVPYTQTEAGQVFGFFLSTCWVFN